MSLDEALDFIAFLNYFKSIKVSADIVVWNPNTQKTISAKTHHQAVDFNIFEGIQVTGLPEVTVCRGKVVWENNELNVEKGSGRFIALAPNCDYVFGSSRLAEVVSNVAVFEER